MKWPKWLSGGDANERRDNSVKVAEDIVRRRYESDARGEWHADERLYLDLCRVLGQERGQEVYHRFRHRLSRSDPHAAHLLVHDIVVGLHDAAHDAATSHPITVQHQKTGPARDTTPPSAAKTCAKITRGEPLTDAEEDALLYRDLL